MEISMYEWGHVLTLVYIYISRLCNAEGGHVIGRSLYVVMLNKRCIFTSSKHIFFNKYVYSIKVNKTYVNVSVITQ